jgi:phage baseplate assembly protein W
VPKGFKYPFRISNGAPEEARDAELVASSLFVLQSQDRRERAYDPENGVNLLSYVFENTSELVLAYSRNELRLAVTNYEPRANLLGVDAFYETLEGQGLSLVTEIFWEYGGRRFSTTFSESVPVG